MKKLSSVLLSASLSIALLTTGCSTAPANTNADQAPGTDAAKTAPTAQDQHSKLLLLNNLREPTSLDPPIGFDQVSYDVLNNLMEGLTRLGKDHSPEPAGATEWKVSPDGKTYTFTLRENKWSNGQPVTAHDYEFAWKRIADPKVAAESAYLSYVIAGAEEFNSGKGTADTMKVKAVDDKTLEVTLVNPASYFTHMVSNPVFFPVHKATAQKDPKWFTEANTFVGNGPFKLTEWKHDSEIKMAKNENYWDAPNVKVDGVLWRMVDDPNTAYQLYQTGELHTTANIPPDLADQLFAEGKIKTEDGAGTYYYSFNTKAKPFTNVKIRKAFSMAVDRQKIVEFVTKAKEKPATGYVSYGYKDVTGGDFRDVGGVLLQFNADEAKKLLAEGMAEEGYKTLPEVTLTYNTDPKHQRIAQVTQEMLKENLGVEVKLKAVESKVLREEQKKGNYQMSRASFLPDFGDPINYLDGFLTGNPYNRGKWSNAKFDTLIKDAYRETDETKRFAKMHEAEKIFMEDAAVLPMYYYSTVYLQSDKVEGLVRHALGYWDLKWADMK